jgi:hypothetical protein
MKLSRFAVTLSAAALLFASAAIAGETNKTSVHITQKVTVDGKTLDSGKYTAEWGGTGPNVQVTLRRGKDTVATFPARINQEASPNPDDAVGTTDAPDGSKQLSSIYPNGKRISLQLDNASAAAPSGTSPSR